MPARLPPLNAIRAFVVAARHLSFTRAADELCVTHSAVSRQIKTLEDYLGVALFERLTRQVVLTAAGQRFYAEVGGALDRIGAAAQSFTARPPERAVRINVRPSFAVRWLIPRLPSFVERCPAIEPQVITSTLSPDKAADTFDVAIRRGLKGWPGDLTLQPFLEDDVHVVAAPALLRAQPIADIHAIRRHVLLSAKTRKEDWPDWQRFVGLARIKPAGTLQFDHLHFVLQAAVDGLGIALCPASLVGNDLATGRLVSPLPAFRMPLQRYYYCVAPSAGPEARQFVAWLESELAAQGGTA